MSIEIEQWREFFASRVKADTDLVRGYLRFLERCAERELPAIFEERHLSYILGIPYRELAFYSSAAPQRYRKFSMPKRRGGHRIINVPAPVLLEIQRWILKFILYKLPMSDFAHGGVPGRSIITNAKPHLGAKAVLRIDLRSFFDTVPIALGVKIFESAGYPPGVSRSLALLCFEAGCLPQGAATSSTIANLAALSLDKRLSALAAEYALSYTRYVDDLTFSGRSISPRFVHIVKEIVEQSKFRVNTDKTQLMRGSSPKFVTGLSVGGTSLKVPRAFRRNIKNEAFQLLKRGVLSHLAEKEHADPLILERVLGKLAFWLQVEPDAAAAQRLFADLASYRKTIATEIVLPEPIRTIPVAFPDSQSFGGEWLKEHHQPK